MDADRTGVQEPPGYAFVRRIGRGSGGVVWEAQQLSTGRPVAVKVVDLDGGDPDAVRRECHALAALATHPHVVTIYDADVRDGRSWLAMELCRRGSLAAHVAAHGPLDAIAALHVLAVVADALAAAHGRRILHCDVKPANLLVTDHGAVVVSDFGLARDAFGRSATAGYTLPHVAPELLSGAPPSPASDVYSLGTTTWELLAGLPPFGAHGPPAHGTPSVDLPARAPVPLVDLLRAMVAVRPDDRPDGMAGIAEYARDLLWERDPAALGAPLLPALPADGVDARGSHAEGRHAEGRHSKGRHGVPGRAAGPATVMARRSRLAVDPVTEPAVAAPGRRRIRPAHVVATLLLVAAAAALVPAVRPYSTGATPSAPPATSAPAAPTDVRPTDVRGLVTLRVVDGAAVGGLAARAAADFRTGGWLVEAVDDDRVRATAVSTVYHRPGTVEEDAARRLAAEFGLQSRPRPEALRALPPGLVVVLAADYRPRI